jgi:hypothetical protein
MEQRPLRVWPRAWLTIPVAAWLVACQGLPTQLPFAGGQADLAEPGWRVVERLGEARYLAPGMPGWEEIPPGGMIPAGSQVATGRGGRLIVDHAASQLSASTDSRFILPGWESGESVRQTAGWLRYRIATAPAASFSIETPFLDLVVDDAVLDVTVGEDGTEVAVVSGRVRVRTLDERRQIDLHAGFTGFASLQGEALAVRRGPGERLEPVPPIVLPALHPERGAAAAAPGAAERPSLAAFAGRAATAANAFKPTMAAPAQPATTYAEKPLAPPSKPGPLPSAVPAPAGEESDAALAVASPVAQTLPRAEAEPAEAAPAAQSRRPFDALTEGLLDGLLPALPPAPRRGAN